MLIDIAICGEDYLLMATNIFWLLNRYDYFQLNITHILTCMTNLHLHGDCWEKILQSQHNLSTFSGGSWHKFKILK